VTDFAGRSRDDEASPPKAVDKSTEMLASLLDRKAFLAQPTLDVAPGACLIAVCTDDRHPSLLGRVRVHWTAGEGNSDAWLPVLRHVVARVGDQLLLSQPSNGAQPIVVGVIDGFAQRAQQPEALAARLELKPDEVLRIEDTRGRPLLEIKPSTAGPVLRLLHTDLSLEVDGKLAFEADSIRMNAKHGRVEIEATDDVCVKGEVIHLN
jgi:hypothetical protein